MEPVSSDESDSENETQSIASEVSSLNSDESNDEVSSSEENIEDENNFESNKNEKLFNFPTLPKFNHSSEMCFEDLIKIRDRIGIKKFNEEISIRNNKTNDTNKSKTNFKRENKNRPQELPSKNKIPLLRQVIQTSKTNATRDPRFDDLCGSEYNEEVFDKRYKFLEDIKEREKRQLAKVLKKSKNKTKQVEVKYLLNRMKQQSASKDQRSVMRETEREWKKEEKKKVKQGIKKPFFLKESEKKKLLEAKRNELLKKSGNLEKMEGKRQKKLKSKESRIMPYERRTVTS